MANNVGESRALALPPGTYAYLQDATSGKVQIIVGPGKINIKEDQDIPIRFDANTQQFLPCGLQQALCKHIRADKTQYVVLHNPAFQGDGKLLTPAKGPAAPQDQPALNYGETVNIPGNISIALWPEQSAEVIERHELDYNQYLLVRVIDGDVAKKNWAHASVQTVEGAEAEESEDFDFTTGALNVVKGTQYKYFIPCTGLEVLGEPHLSNRAMHDGYVREAISLENLQFCILLDQNGSKRYERGPQVVFPKPTESFWVNEKDEKVFRAYELSERSGVYVMVTTDYKEGDKSYKAGQKLFITGKDVIYYPRAEHAVIKYGEHARHYATAVPPGEGRYVLNRLTGVIRLVVGPEMILLNPEIDVFVKRPLTIKQCEDWFPGNRSVLEHNMRLLGQANQGVGYVEDAAHTSAVMAFAGESASYGMRTARSVLKAAGAPTVADSVIRSTTYAEPRAITLNTKLDGAVVVKVWTGYAVSVVNATGGRRIVKADTGEQTVILEYDETLEVLQLSTGKPKNTDNLLRTVYLNVLNNKISDIIEVTTSDHVAVQLKVSYRVNFEGDPAKWFSVSNPVKLLCDHARSVLKGAVRKQTIKAFYADPVSVVRDLILGPKPADGTERKGMSFSENGMRIVDIDVLGTVIPDGKIAAELVHAQHDALAKTLTLENKTREVELDHQLQALLQAQLTAQSETESLKAKLELAQLECKSDRDTAIATNRLLLEVERKKLVELQEEIRDLEHARELARDQSQQDLQIDLETSQQVLRLKALEQETASAVAKYQASGDSLAAFAAQISEGSVRAAFIKAAVALNPISGGDLVKTIEQMAPGLGGALGETLKQLTTGVAK